MTRPELTDRETGQGHHPSAGEDELGGATSNTHKSSHLQDLKPRTTQAGPQASRRKFHLGGVPPGQRGLGSQAPGELEGCGEAEEGQHTAQHGRCLALL